MPFFCHLLLLLVVAMVVVVVCTLSIHPTDLPSHTYKKKTNHSPFDSNCLCMCIKYRTKSCVPISGTNWSSANVWLLKAIDATKKKTRAHTFSSPACFLFLSQSNWSRRRRLNVFELEMPNGKITLIRYSHSWRIFNNQTFAFYILTFYDLIWYQLRKIQIE